MANRINFQVGYTVDKAGLTEMQSLFQRIANLAKEPGAELNTGLQKAAATANTLDGILEKTFNTNLGTLNVTKFNQELTKSGLTLKTVQSSLSGIGNQGATAYNRLAQAVLGTNLQLKESSKLLDSMATTMTNTVKWGITSSIFNNITNAIQRAYSYSKQLDTSLNDIRIVTDKSAENMEKFAQSANIAAKELGASTLDYTNASLIYYQQGLSDAEVAARAETTIKAANVTGQTGEAVSEQLTAVWNGYKVTAEETEAYVDKLAAVAATTAADLEELSVGMSKVAAAANAMGVDFDDLNAQIATIVSVTRQAPESVGTALKTIYARLGDLKVDGVDEFGVKLGEVSAQMQTMGIQILDQEGNLRDMSSVIAEVAQKWGTWTEAQRQAAAVAMAGKRQYNNLIALFDNWDMYTDALNTSQEALGTLQHQQDIYMESTAAKLKTLKATWQDLYEGLIDNDELNTGIEGLTNLVQVFDNFIDSFGGGIKSIGAFGAIVANIFNQQIVNGINAAIQRQNIFKQNLELAQANAQVRANGVAELGANATPQDLAIQANTKEQLIYAQKIYDARVGLNQEQTNSLINYQKELGELKGQVTLNDQLIKKLNKEYQLTEQYGGLQEWNGETIEKINLDYADRIEKIEQIKKLITDITTGEINIGAAKTKISALTKSIGTEEAKRVQEAMNLYDTTYDIEVHEDKINELLNGQIAKYKNAQAAAEKINDARIKNIDLNANYQNTKQEADAMLELGEKSIFTAQSITTVTSALSSMAMAWSSVSSLIKTWNDETASFGDKITQTFMTLGMSLPMIISSFTKLRETLGTTSTIWQVITATTEAHTLAVEADAAAQAAANPIIASATTIEEAKNWALEQGIIKEGQSVTQTTLKEFAEYKAAAATKAHAAAQETLNASMLANPIGIAIALLVALAAATAVAVTEYKKYIQAQIDANNQTIEQSNAIQEEVNSNKELYDSYDKLYNQYKNNEVEKEALYDVTDKLCEKYNLEEGYLAKLTGNYDKLTEAAKKARLEELKQAQGASQREVRAASSNLLPTGQQSKQGTRVGDRYQVLLSSGIINEKSDTKAQSILSNYLKGTDLSIGQTGEILSSVDANDTAAIVEQYDQIVKAIDAMDTALKNTEKASSDVYQNAKSYIDSMGPAIEEYRTALEELDDYDAQIILTQHNLEGIKSLEEYSSEVNSIREELKKQFDGDSEKVNSILNTYLNSIDNEFVKIGFGLEALKKELDLSDTEFDKLLNWSDEDKKLLLSGIVEFDGYKTEEELKKALEIAKNNLSEEDLTIAVSLREKVSSDKKLTKSQVKEMAGEQSTLAEDYEVELSDFDDQSQLKQLDTLNEIVNEKIELNRKYIDNAKQTAQEEKETLEDRKENWEQEKYILEQKKIAAEHGAGSTLFSEEDANRLNELNDMLVQTEGEIKDLSEIAENGLPFEELNELNYDNLISGIDGIITEAEVLKNLTDDIGESWTIAADKIENFGKNFPEILESAENYKFLQDGSLQLTEAGRQALEDTFTARQKNLNAINEEYQLELQKQADIQQATADYYTQQADLLEAYLNGEADAKETEEQMEQSLADYKNQLMEITGANNEELNNLMQENGALTRQSAEADEKAIYDYWCSVGEAAEAASLAYENKSFNPPGFKGGGGSSGGGKSRSFQGKSASEATSSLERLDSKQISSLIDNYRKKAEDASNKAADYISKKVSAGAAAKAFENSVDNAVSGKGNGKSKGGGGSKEKEQKEKEGKKWDDEFDRYWQIKKAIDAVDRAIKRLDKDQEKLFGYELIKSLKNENELLEQQKANYEALAEAQKQEAAELQGVLAGYGVAFDASGAITNYAAATSEALSQYNGAIAQYNAGLLDDTALDVYEKNYDAFKKELDRYDKLYYDEMQDTQDKLDDIWREILANNLKAWEVEVKLKLDMKELKRGWNDFIHEITKDFQKVYKDLRIDLMNILDDAATFIGEEGSIATIINAVHDVTGEIDKLRSGRKSDMFESISQAQEKLKELNDELQDSGKSLHDLWVNAWDAYIDGIDEASDKFDDLMDRFEEIDDELEFQGELIQLLYGEEAYALMDKLYKGQETSMLTQLDSVKKQRDMWIELWQKSGATMENQSSWTEDQKKYYDEWMDAQEKLNELTLDYIKLLKEDYLNTINDILKQLETSLTGGSSISNLETEWERISAHADKYYDDVEGAYKIQTLANKIDQSIADTSNLKAQQRLQEFREKEIKYLREKENLTEYDLQAAEARYQIMLKEIALQDAQNNKTSMKLTRNEQGNWSYQYIADQDDITSKRQDLLDAYNDLYQLASDAYENNLDSLQKLQQEYLDSAREIYENENISEEERQQKLLELRQWYLNEYQLLAEENSLYRNDLELAGSALLLNIYETDKDAYEYMTESEKELLKGLIDSSISDFMDLEEKIKDNYNHINDKAKNVMIDIRQDWTSGAQTLADLWNKDSGFSVKTQVVNAYNKIEEANNKYQQAVDKCAELVERDFTEEGIAGAIQYAEDAVNSLKDATAEMVYDSIGYLNDLKTYVDNVAQAWQSVQQEIMNAIQLIEEYLKYVGEINRQVAAQQAAAAAQAQQAAAAAAAKSGSGSSGSGSKGVVKGTGETRQIISPTAQGGYSTMTVDGNGNILNIDSSHRIVNTAQGNVALSNSTSVNQLKYNQNEAMYKKMYGTSKFATGGYTGTWNDSSDGRLAFLHQKELVLNENDTKNFLSGISMIRDMSGLNGAIGESITRAVANMVYTLGKTKIGSISSVSNNNTNNDNKTFNINAEFPNANNVNDIKEAILSLPNIASQYISNNRK